MPTFASATSVLICRGRGFQDRVRIEAEVLAEEGRHAPEHVPAMLDYDGRMFTIAMAYIGPPVSRSLNVSSVGQLAMRSGPDNCAAAITMRSMPMVT
jgi:hypothetical protein